MSARRRASKAKSPRRAAPSVARWTDIVVAVVRDGERLLVARRPVAAPLGGYDEFPGGKREGDETLEATCVREVLEETGLAIAVDKLLAVSWFEGDGGRLALSFFQCHPLGATEPNEEARTQRQARWILRSELAQLNFPPANQKVIELLLAETAATS